MAVGLRPNQWYPIRKRTTSIAAPTLVTPPPPAVPTAIMFSPAAPSIVNTSSIGTVVCGISVTMSDGSTFVGSLSFAAPNNNAGGLFGLSGSQLVTAATLPGGASTQNVTIAATQGGVTITKSLAIQLTTVGSTLTTFALVSPNNGVLPFSVAVPIAKGLALGQITTNLGSEQVIIKRSWNDGSAKHVIVSGTYVSPASNSPVVVTVANGTPPSGTNLTATDIQNAAPVASVNLGVNGTINLSSLLAAPTRTWLSGPQMVECHYETRSVTGNLFVRFTVRLWLGGRMYIKVRVDNGWVDIANADQVYTPVVSINNVPVYQPGANVNHDRNTGYTYDGWIGGDPQVTPQHNVTDIMASKLVPNADLAYTQSADWFNRLVATYTPWNPGNYPAAMGAGGQVWSIGPIPGWEEGLFTTNADPRVYRAILLNAKMLPAFAIVWRGHSDNNLLARPSVYSGYSAAGAGGSGGDVPQTSHGLQWNQGHCPACYLAYLLTGDYDFMEIMGMQGVAAWLTQDVSNGQGTSRPIVGETRSRAWSGWRNISSYAALAPTSDLLQQDFVGVLRTMITGDLAVINTAGINTFGIDYSYEYGTNVDGATVGYIRNFMQLFYIISLGMMADLEPLPDVDMTNVRTIEAFVHKWEVGLMGGDGSGSTFNFVVSGAESMVINSAYLGTSPGALLAANMAANFNGVWQESSANTSTVAGLPLPAAAVGSNTFLGASGSDPTNAQSYFRMLLPAIAYGVDHAAVGAPAALSRFVGATNFNTVRFASDPTASVAGSDPEWSIIPRSGLGGGDGLSTLLSQMTPGTWAQLNATGQILANHFYSGSLAAAIRGATGPGSVCLAWCGAVWDSTNNRIVFPCNGGHNDYGGNETYYFDLRNLVWNQPVDGGTGLNRPPSNPFAAGGYNGNGVIPVDGLPASRHSYSAMAYHPTTDNVIVVSGSQMSTTINTGQGAFPTGPGGTDAHAFKMKGATGGWSQIAFRSELAHNDAVTAFNSKDGLIYSGTGQGIYKYDPTNDPGGWITVTTTTIGSSSFATAAIAPNRGTNGEMWIAGNGDQPGATGLDKFDLATGAVTRVVSTGDQTVQTSSGPGFDYYPPTGEFVGWNGLNQTTGTPNIWRLNPATVAWTVQAPAVGNTVTPSPPVPNGTGGSNGTFTRFRVVQAKSGAYCMILINDSAQPVYVYKPAF